MNKEQRSALIGVLLSALVAILSIFGYNVVVVQPALSALRAAAGPGFAAAVGDTNFTNVVAEDVTASDDVSAGDDLIVTDDLSIAGEYAVTNGSNDQEIGFGRLLTPVAAATILPAVHGVSTPVAAGCSPLAPSYSGAWTCAAAIGSAGQITVTVLENDATPVAGALGYWVVGQ